MLIREQAQRDGFKSQMLLQNQLLNLQMPVSEEKDSMLHPLPSETRHLP